MHPDPRRIVPIVLVLALLAGGAWWVVAGRAASERGVLSASGTIEATEIVISPELGGRVIAVNVGEGQAVEAGEALIEFDTALLNAQRVQAEALLAAAQAGHAAAKANYELLRTGASAEQLAVAQAQVRAAEAQVEAAQAALGVLDVQLAKLTLTSPVDGVVLARAIEPGEFVGPGAVLLVVGQLTDLTISVYVPEDRYGEIRLEQTATVTVDSFPDELFSARVTHIADQAEFTPRNVQTAAGRRTTVFAVRLSVSDPEGKLKPGMPADVRFE